MGTASFASTSAALCRLSLLAVVAALLAPGAALPSTAAPPDPDALKAGATDHPHFVPDHTCPDTMFRCKNGRCLPKTWTCEGQDDCGDDSDEDPELCKGRAPGPAPGPASDEDDAVPVVRVTPRPPARPRPSKPTPLDLLGARPAPLSDVIAPWRVSDNELADVASAVRRGDHDVRDVVIAELLARLRTRNVVIERLLAPAGPALDGDLNGLAAAAGALEEDPDDLADLKTPPWRRGAFDADALFLGGRRGRAVRRAISAASPDDDVGIGDGPLASVYTPKGDKGNPVSLSTYFTGVRSDPLVRGRGSPWTVIPVLNELLPQRTSPSVYVAKVLERVRRSLSDPASAPGPRAIRRRKGRPRHGSSTTTTTTTTPSTTTAAAESSAETPQDPSFAPGAVAEVVDIELDGDDSDVENDDDDNDDEGDAAVVQDGTATPLEVVEPAHLPAGDASSSPGGASSGGASSGGPSPGVQLSTTTPVPINVVTTESEYALDRRQQRETARLNLDVLRRTVTMLQQETNKLAAEREMMTASRDMLRAQVRLVNTDRSRVDSARRKLDLERDLLQSQMLGRALSWAPPAWYRPAPPAPPGPSGLADQRDKTTGVEFA